MEIETHCELSSFYFLSMSSLRYVLAACGVSTTTLGGSLAFCHYLLEVRVVLSNGKPVAVFPVRPRRDERSIPLCADLFPLLDADAQRGVEALQARLLPYGEDRQGEAGMVDILGRG